MLYNYLQHMLDRSLISKKNYFKNKN